MIRNYEDPRKTSENRMPPRAHYLPGGAADSILLSGKWRFAYFERDIDLPAEITEWGEINVPSCWQLEGYGEPNYSNINYPYPCDPPYVPDDNPCGVYEREFELEDLDRRVYFMLLGVSSCAFVYLNGRYVGFTESSRLTAEFDLTDYANVGCNTLRVKVLKWCCGSYLEDQDCFRYNGIFRDCYLLLRPEGHLFDVDIKSDESAISLSFDGEADVEIYGSDKLIGGGHADRSFSFTPEDPILWNAEKPYLYTVKILSAGEEMIFKTALRSVAVSDKKELLINGSPVKLHGVNHHDTHPTAGYCMSREDILRDLTLMKSLNINCVRTSHYPPHPDFAALCDELGIYVVLETDNETHGILRRYPNVDYGYDSDSPDWPCSNPDWFDEHIDRIRRTYECFKNYPSVIMWSLGNEAGYGENHGGMIEYLRSRDMSRLIHFESASADEKGRSKVDVYSCMYPSYEHVEALANDKKIDQPIFLCEYSHAMGNGPGDVFGYNELFDKYDNLIGGCVWEWADHVVLRDGVQLYGGDFEGELTNDGNFCCDGMVFSDRTFKSGTYEVKAAYQPIRTEYSRGVLTVTNRLDFTDLSEYSLICELECDGKVTEKKDLRISLAPHASAELDLGFEKVVCDLGAHVNVYLYSADGVLVAECQHEAEHDNAWSDDATIRPALTVSEDDRRIFLKGEGFEYIFSKHDGFFESIKVNGREALAAVPRLSAARALTDNDMRMADLWNNRNVWQGENLDTVFSKVYDADYGEGIISVKGSLAGVSRKPFFRYISNIVVEDSGTAKVIICGKVRPDCAYLPRFGIDFLLPPESGEFSYYGRGPLENYCDMCHSAKIGEYESSAKDEYVNYVRPQEHGNHTDVRRLKIGGLEFRTKTGFEFAVSEYSTSALEAAKHTNELEKDGFVHLRVDYKVSGVGSASCGPELRPEHRLSEKEIRFEFSITPIL